MGTWDWNIATDEVTWSAQLERLYGFAPGTMERNRVAFMGCIHPDDQERVQRSIDEAIVSNGEHHAEFRIIWPDGSEHWIVGEGQVMYEQGQATRMLGISRDVTERKRAEAERALLLDREQAARKQVEAALDIREQFLSVASHELRTPLTALLGYSSLLQKRVRQQQPIDRREIRAIDAIAHQTHRLHALVVALLDLSRLEQGHLRLDFQPLDLVPLAQRVVNEVQALLPVHHHLQMAQSHPSVMVRGDEMRLEQVLENLLHNAIKYSPDGGLIEVRVEQDAAEIRLLVSDEGIGIPQDAQAQVFERFFRAANVGRQQISGLGVGLYVVDEIVRRHGGRVDVQSREDHGATFIVRLPAFINEE